MIENTHIAFGLYLAVAVHVDMIDRTKFAALFLDVFCNVLVPIWLRFPAMYGHFLGIKQCEAQQGDQFQAADGHVIKLLGCCFGRTRISDTQILCRLVAQHIGVHHASIPAPSKTREV